jgi:type I restriction enzyme, S subunit
MSDMKLKPNWKLVKFGDVVCQIKDRVTDIENCGLTEYTRGEHFESGNLHLIGRSKLGDGQHGSAFHMRFEPGDVLYVSRNPHLRKVAVADYEGICANTSYVFRANEEYLLQELLPFIMQTEDFVEYTIQHKRGSTNFYLNPSDIEPYEFPLPPIDEQRRIAQLLWAADDTLEKHRLLKDKIQKLRDSTRKELFTFGLRNTPTIETKHGRLPSNWKLKKLGDVFGFLDNMRVPLKVSDRNKRQGTYPYYGAVGIIDYIDDYIFDETTLLLEEDGMNLVFRSSPVVFKATGKYWVNNHAHVLRPKLNNDIDFYFEYLEYISYLPYVTGTYQKKITKSDCMAIPVIYPPFDEQKEIAEKFIKIDQAETEIDNHIKNIEKLKKELMTGVLL